MNFYWVVILLCSSVTSTNYKYIKRHGLKLESGIMQSVHTNTFIECLSQCSRNVSCKSVSFHSQFGECMLSNASFVMYDGVKRPRALPAVTWLSGITLRYGGRFTFSPPFTMHRVFCTWQTICQMV